MNDCRNDHTSAGPIVFRFRPPSPTIRRPGLFFDRDGVINLRKSRYISHWQDFNFTAGVQHAVGELSRIGIPIIIVSNQAGVEKGLVSIESLEDLTLRFVATMTFSGSSISAVYYCPHTPEGNCTCRKPRIEMLTLASRQFGVDLSNSLFVGDTISDVQASTDAGCTPILFSPTRDTLHDCCQRYKELPAIAWNARQVVAQVQRLLIRPRRYP